MNKITPQQPAEGIMITYRSIRDDMICYKVDCTCGNEDDAIDFYVEVDSDIGTITVHTETTQKTDWWSDPANQNVAYAVDNEFLFELNYIVRGWINGLIHRLKWTWRLWVDGYLRYQSYTIMTKQQALNYAKTLEAAIEELEKKTHESA